jgi:glycosyltransferase involved in cell wall biosynthesis
MISIPRRTQTCPTFVLAILGDYGRVESALARSIERLEQIVEQSDCRLVVAWDDSRWESVPLVQTLGMRFGRDRLTVFCGECPDQPAKLFSLAAQRAQSDVLHFVWPGCLPQWNRIVAACDRLHGEGLDWLGFIDPKAGLPELFLPQAGDHFYCHYLSCERPLPLCQAVVRRASFLAMHGFRASPLLQREFDADYWLRSLRSGQKGSIRAGNLATSLWTWDDFPLHKDFRVPRYLSHSYRVRSADCPPDLLDGAAETELLSQFAADLSPDLHRAVARLAGIRPLSPANPVREQEESYSSSPTDQASIAPPYKIAVTGGTWEYLNNRLYFYNLFAELAGQGLFTYIPLLDSRLVPQRDLRGIDAVIISRGRHAKLRSVLDYCRQHSIPTLYMIDDNWFSIGKDWLDPPYASIFSPGLPQYEMFLSCLRECDAVIVYNDVLAEDVGRYAKRVLRLPPIVRPADFAAPLRHPELKERIDGLREWRQQTGGLLAGYAGALRYRDAAFQALANVSQRVAPPVKVVLFGRVSPRQLEFFDDRAAVLPFVGYDAYAAALGLLAPDILIAPLDRSRTSMSKCPIKYLDYSVAGAAGVYRDTPPYSQAIVDGKTGLLVREDDAASWCAAISRLIEDEELRRSIVLAARQDIQQQYVTPVVAPACAAAIRGVIEGHGQGRRSPATCKERVPC